ncbi:MAG: ABC transporter permease [Oscillospiraceae bacterium]|nr:ABC transporter permease [Oscillospiraceae bacterium]
MRYLISLALKYIRRQKLRSVLTFSCLMLASFVLNTFSAYFSSGLQSSKNLLIEADDGFEWEIYLDDVIRAAVKNQTCTEEKAKDIIRNHPAVASYFFLQNWEMDAHVNMDPSVSQKDGISYWELRFDDNAPRRYQSIQASQLDSNVTFDQDSPYHITQSLADNAVFLPNSAKELGYQIGDSVTIYCTPVHCRINETMPEVRAVLEYIEKRNAEEEAKGSTTRYAISYFTPENGQKPSFSDNDRVIRRNMLQLLNEQYDLNTIAFADTEQGDTVSVTMTVAGFGNYEFNSMMYGFQTMDLFAGSQMAPFLEQLDEASKVFDVYSDSNESFFENRTRESQRAATVDHILFEDSLAMITESLGLDPMDYPEYFLGKNDMLLALKLKGADAIVTLIPVLWLFVFLLLIIWAISRFVIDNAFEISVQERSMQFAALRIMGASKRQLLALVFSEATAYSVTAIPLGALLAFLCCKLCFGLLAKSARSAFVFHLNPYIVCLCILLNITAIYISAYTSALYASRKLTPAEALHFGKPKKKRRNLLRKHRSKLTLNAKKFIRRYTWQNIQRTKRRFVISTIALSLGLLMLTFLLDFASIFYLESKLQKNAQAPGNAAHEAINKAIYHSDFEFFSSENNYALAVETFGDHPLFRAMYYTYTSSITVNESSLDQIHSLTPYAIADSDFPYLTVYGIDRTRYELEIQPYTGVDYDTFEAQDHGLIIYSEYDEKALYDASIHPNTVPDRYPLGYTAAKENATIEVWDDFAINPQQLQLTLDGSVCLPTASILEDGILLPIHMVSQFDQQSYATISLLASYHADYEELSPIVNEFASKTQMEYLDNYTFATGGMKAMLALAVGLGSFLFSLWLVGILSMINSIHTGILNRRSELSMLRAVGCSRKQMRRMIILEGILFSATATVIGAVLGAVAALCYLPEFVTDVKHCALLIPVAIVITVILLIAHLLIAALSAWPGIKAMEQFQSY